jgi:hypothetical protein
MQGLSPLAVALEDNGSTDSVGYDDCEKSNVEAREASTETLQAQSTPATGESRGRVSVPVRIERPLTAAGMQTKLPVIW